MEAIILIAEAEMEWKPSYGVFMDESYKLTYPDGKRKKGPLIQTVI